MNIVIVSEKGQMVIPAELRKKLGIGPGTKLEVIAEGGGFRAIVEPLRKTLNVADLAGISGYTGPRIPIGELSGLAAARRLAKQGKL